MDDAQLAQAVDRSVEAHAFSGVVAIRQGDAVRYERAAGYADRSNRLDNTLATRFGIASGTKFLTALAIGKLIDARQITLSTRVRDCVDAPFPHASEEITIQHLLTHTSGIPDYFDEELVPDVGDFFLSTPWYALKGPRDYLPLFPDGPMKFAPGERFAYSNGGYILLGVVVEAVTGMRYQAFVEQEIFQAIGMHRSGFFAMNQLPEQTALGYIDSAEGWRTNIYNLPIVGASDGGAFTTAQDIATLWRAFWRGAIVSPELVERYAQPFVSADSQDGRTWYGHGLWVREDAAGRREVYILGGDAGVSFRSGVWRDTGLAVTVISNTSGGAWPVVREIAAAVATG